ncbi:Hypothetical predicted protein [Drosophila guanche]|uniref:Uncharacterized protein n=1 Tax=Drosophila guanche TaxID=7266 RepID=A0A3B0JZV4_DROGU|nr:Hypothetical predicted protein [Drosophila guanche]
MEWRQWWASADVDVDDDMEVAIVTTTTRTTNDESADRQTEEDEAEDEHINEDEDGDEHDNEDVDENEKIIYPHVSTSACATPTEPHAQTDEQERPWLQSQDFASFHLVLGAVVAGVVSISIILIIVATNASAGYLSIHQRAVL